MGYGLAPLWGWERLGLAVAGLLLVDPGLVNDVIGLAIVAVLGGRQYLAWRVNRKGMAGTIPV